MDSETFIVKARGLPWSATAKEITQFLCDVVVARGEEGVHITLNNEGRPSGEAFVEVNSQDDVDRACGHNNEHMGKRYIEVMESKQVEMEWALDRMSTKSSTSGDGVMRLRGIPFNATVQDVYNFLDGFQIVNGGVTLAMDTDGRMSGDAFVEFATLQDADRATEKHKEKMAHRYIEVFKSSKSELLNAKQTIGQMQFRGNLMGARPGPYDRPGAMGGRTRGRGGMNLGPSGFSNSIGGFDDNSGMNRRGGKAMRGGRGGGMGGNMPRSTNNNVSNSTTGHSIHMRGLPFEAGEEDVRKFFGADGSGEPGLSPSDVRILYEQSGRPKGECDVDFASHIDCEKAMKKDKQNMGHRYIELFLKSTPGGGAWSGSGSGGMGGNMGQMGNYGGGYGGMGMGGGGMGMGGMNQQMGMSGGGNMAGMGGGMASNYTNFGGSGMGGANFTNDSVGYQGGQMAQNSGGFF